MRKAAVALLTTTVRNRITGLVTQTTYLCFFFCLKLRDRKFITRAASSPGLSKRACPTPIHYVHVKPSCRSKLKCVTRETEDELESELTVSHVTSDSEIHFNCCFQITN